MLLVVCPHQDAAEFIISREFITIQVAELVAYSLAKFIKIRLDKRSSFPSSEAFPQSFINFIRSYWKIYHNFREYLIG